MLQPNNTKLYPNMFSCCPGLNELHLLGVTNVFLGEWPFLSLRGLSLISWPVPNPRVTTEPILTPNSLCKMFLLWNRCLCPMNTHKHTLVDSSSRFLLEAATVIMLSCRGWRVLKQPRGLQYLGVRGQTIGAPGPGLLALVFCRCFGAFFACSNSLV